MKPDVPQKGDIKVNGRKIGGGTVMAGFVYAPYIPKFATKQPVVMDGLLCACNGLPCDGICRATNLYRERKDLDRCPSAYVPKPKTDRKAKIRLEQDRDRKFRRQRNEEHTVNHF